MELALCQVKLPYSCFGIEVAASGIVHKAAPVGNWMVGKTITYVTTWVEQRGGTVVLLPKEEQVKEH